MADKHDSGYEFEEETGSKEIDGVYPKELDDNEIEDAVMVDITDLMDMDVTNSDHVMIANGVEHAVTSSESSTPTAMHMTTHMKKKLVNSNKGLSSWDPFVSPDWDKETASALCISRLKRDLTAIYSEAPPLIYVVPDENDMTKIHAVISGPLNTPYEGGFFYFFLRAPPMYPIQPPRVKLMSTGSGTVRFNPNFYKNGKVCLSTLGTWAGPPWSAAQSLLSLLLSIQSLMNERPYHNEPGYEKERCVGDSDRYNKCIVYQTLSVAVCDAAEGVLAHIMPPSLQQLVEKCFITYREHYQDVINRYKYLDGHKLNDPYNCNTGEFKFSALEERIEKLYILLSAKHKE